MCHYDMYQYDISHFLYPAVFNNQSFNEGYGTPISNECLVGVYKARLKGIVTIHV
jgi:hypothetical protein